MHFVLSLGLTIALAWGAAAEPITVTCGEEAEAVCDREPLVARMTRERDQVAAFLGLDARPILIHIGDSWRGRPVEVARAWPEAGRIVIPPRMPPPEIRAPSPPDPAGDA